MKSLIYFIILILFPISVNAGGFIIVTDFNPNSGNYGKTNYTLESKSLNIKTDINNQFATTVIDQVFYNQLNRNVEGWFLFPVPKGAIIKNFAMEINGKRMQAELLDADKARKIYIDIVRKLKDPALLEYANQLLYKVRIFPIESHKEKRIHISYAQILEMDNHSLEYIFPLNTKKYSSAPIKNISFNINVHSDIPIRTIYSPSHKIEVIRKGNNQAHIGFEKTILENNRDLKLFIGNSSKDIGITLTNYKPDEEDGFFFLNISPGLVSDKSKILAKDIVFVLDVSGSMSGDKMINAKKALLFCVANLNQRDKFQLIKFSTEAEALFKHKMPANHENKDKAKKFIQSFRAIGGTNIDEALSLAFKEKQSEGKPNMIIFITDGKPTIGETDEKKLINKIKDANLNETRIFTFGIGEDINIQLLDKITEETKAYRSYVSPNEDIELKISNFFNKVNSPILTDVNVHFEGVRINNLFPKNLPDIFKGSSINLFGRFSSLGDAAITLTGKVNNKIKSLKYSIKFKENKTNDFIASLWAARKIGYLLDQIRLNGESKELKDEIVRLSKKYGIITPYTSYLILEDEEINIANNHIAPDRRIFTEKFYDESEFKSRSKKEYNNLHKKSGKSGIISSGEVQNLRQASNLDDQNQGANRMVYYNKANQKKDLSKEYQNCMGRAFYQRGKSWIDNNIQMANNKTIRKIKFGDKTYFQLLNQHPELSQILALGKNLQFIYKNQFYEIHE